MQPLIYCSPHLQHQIFNPLIFFKTIQITPRMVCIVVLTPWQLSSTELLKQTSHSGPTPRMNRKIVDLYWENIIYGPT